jgi:hypothetical protein
MPLPATTLQDDLETAIATALIADEALMSVCRVAVDPDLETQGTVRGSALLGIEMSDIQSGDPTGPGPYLTQTEEATVLITLGLKAKRVEAHKQGWQIMRQVRRLVSGLVPTMGDRAYTAQLPGFYHLETSPLGRDAKTGVQVFASLYQINLQYRQRT